jgi:predicted enzyme related to lactoylglutathione lyase
MILCKIFILLNKDFLTQFEGYYLNIIINYRGKYKLPRIVHFELNVKDVEKTIKFYETVFGWKFQKWEGPMDYWLIMTGDEKEPGIDGGLGQDPESFPHVVNTIDVEDVDAAVKKVEANGGKIVRPKQVVPGVGWLAYFEDLEGILTGMMQEDPNAK